MANRFSIAVHILSLLGTFEGETLTSDWLAESIGVNPVIVRNITGMLRRAELVMTQQGAKGAKVARPLKKITLLDVFRAVETDDFFSQHSTPNPNCPVGSRLQNTLETVYERAQSAMEKELKATTIDQFIVTLNLKAA